MSDKSTSSPAKERLDRIMSCLDEAVIEIDCKGNIVQTNSAAQRLLGMSPALLEGQPAVSALGAHLVSRKGRALLQEALENPHHELSGISKYENEGEPRRLLRWKSFPLLTGANERTTILILTDLTDIYQVKSHLTSAIEDFLSVIQHRLRTPVLANMRTNDLLLEGAFGPLNKEQGEIVQAMSENTQQIDRLLTMLLDIYRYRNDRMKLHLQNVSVHAVVTPVVLQVRKKCPQRSIELRANVPENLRAVRADTSELRKLICHLAENAVRFAATAVEITAQQNDGKVEITVADDGKGIAQEDVPALFTRFYQASAGGKYTAVTGAGLCLCAEIAKAHGGTLRYQNGADGGARFILTLEAAEETG